jgi:hypothetical protein
MNASRVKIISILWILMFSFYLFSIVSVVNLTYPDNNKEHLEFEPPIYIINVVLLLINLILTFLHVKNGIISGKKMKFFAFLFPVFLHVSALLSPIYLVYFSDVSALKIRADIRAFEGNWEQASDIYIFIKPRIKERNPNISRIQNWLKKAGYYKNEIDGIINHKILDQLKSFQQENNLEPDGIIGESTQFLLFNSIFRGDLDTLSLLEDANEISQQLDTFITTNGIVEFDNTKAILLGIMFQESLKLDKNKLNVQNLREAIIKMDKGNSSNGRFNNEIISKLIHLKKNI